MNEYKQIYAKLFDRTMTEQEFITWAYNLFDAEYNRGYLEGRAEGYDTGYEDGHAEGCRSGE